MPVGGPSHEPPTTQSGRADGASYHGRQPGQQVDQLVGDASNESAKTGGERRLEAGRRSRRCAAGTGGGGAASQMGRPAGREGTRETGADDREEGTTEKVEEQQEFYMWAKAARGRQPRSGEAKPKEAAHRHRFYNSNTATLRT